MKHKNPQPIAIALEYDGDNAPQITAKGSGSVAERIIEIARQNNVSLHEDRDLIEILAQLELGDEIPESVYRAVAEVIAFIYILKGKFPKDYMHDDNLKTPD